MDVMRGETVDAELDRLIEKRSRIGDPEAVEELWKRSVARHNKQRADEGAAAGGRNRR